MTTEPNDPQLNEVRRARTELAATLGAIEYKLNVPKRTAEKVQRLRTENPLVLVGIAAGAAAAVAGVVWLIVRAAKK
jgi:hypothetical protein